MGNKKRAKNIRLNGINPLAYVGVNPYTPPGFYLFQRDPTPTDTQNFTIGDLWLNTQSDPPTAPDIDNLWMLVSLTGNVATWVNFGAGDVEALEGDTGGPVEPDANGIVHTIGDTVQQFIQVNGTPATNTLEWRIIQPNTDAGLLIGNTAANSPLVGDLVSPDGSIIISYAAPNIQLRTLGDPTTNFANFGMTIAGGVITIHSADGSAFSATNRGILDFPSKINPGFRVRIVVTANVSMNFTDMDGNTFGTVAGVAWTPVLPLYLYAIMDSTETTATFGWARVPHHAITPVAANIGSPSSATANDQMSFFLFESVTLANYAQNPVAVLGSARVSKNAADSWTWSAISPGNDGINCWNTDTIFTMALGQNGSPAGQILWSDPAVTTTPIPSDGGGGTDGLIYIIKKDGEIYITYQSLEIAVAGVGTGPSPDTAVYVMPPLPASGQIRGPGIFNTGQISATIGGLFWGFFLDVFLANGYKGIQFTQLENDRLWAGDFFTVGAPWLRGAISLPLLANK